MQFLLKQELELKNRSEKREPEKMYVFDENFNIIFSKVGNDTNITITNEEIEIVKNSYMIIHNHPADITFSTDDIKFMINLNIKKMKVITKNHIYEIDNVLHNKEIPNKKKILNKIDKYYNDTYNKYCDMYIELNDCFKEDDKQEFLNNMHHTEIINILINDGIVGNHKVYKIN